jgi:hypothetical protein
MLIISDVKGQMSLCETDDISGTNEYIKCMTKLIVNYNPIYPISSSLDWTNSNLIVVCGIRPD